MRLGSCTSRGSMWGHIVLQVQGSAQVAWQSRKTLSCVSACSSCTHHFGCRLFGLVVSGCGCFACQEGLFELVCCSSVWTSCLFGQCCCVGCLLSDVPKSIKLLPLSRVADQTAALLRNWQFLFSVVQQRLPGSLLVTTLLSLSCGGRLFACSMVVCCCAHLFLASVGLMAALAVMVLRWRPPGACSICRVFCVASLLHQIQFASRLAVCQVVLKAPACASLATAFLCVGTRLLHGAGWLGIGAEPVCAAYMLVWGGHAVPMHCVP